MSNPKLKEKEMLRGRLKYKAFSVKYPEIVIAARAIRSIEKEKGFDLHHWSYNQDQIKDVIKLDSRVHGKIHGFIKYDQERMMYRTILPFAGYPSGILLDERFKHELYIKFCQQNFKF